MKINILVVIFLVLISPAIAQNTVVEAKTYSSTKGESIYMPIGKISFADRIVEFIQGNPKADIDFTNPEEALGEPNYVHYKVPRYTSLGCGGQLTLEFTDNGFIDMEGPDLYIWEVGPSEESFQFEISKDGEHWLDLGIIEGGKSYIDIAEVVTDIRDVFYFVRITDQKEICTGSTPGADIDAVGTISGVLKINLSADVLFDTAKHTLMPIANASLDSLAKQIKQVGMAKIIVEGHTDSDGSSLYNYRLSERRAKSVINKLKTLLDNNGIYEFENVAYGLSKPRATNETEEGKKLNRRVEVIVLPHSDFYTRKAE